MIGLLRSPTALCSILGIGACLVSAVAVAQVADADRPSLRMRSPFAGPVWRMDVDAAENVVAVSSAYKAISTWQLPASESFATLSVPLRPEQNKRAHAVAISPDGQKIAYSVPPQLNGDRTDAEIGTSRIYILDRVSGRIDHIIDQVPTRPQGMRFSPDGSYLAAVLSSACGLRIFSVKDWSLFYSDDADYGGTQATPRCATSGSASSVDDYADTMRVAFLAPAQADDPWLVTSGDTGIRSYVLKDGVITRKAWAKPIDIDVARPSGIAVSPDGKSLVVADRRCRTDDPGSRWLSDIRRCADRKSLPQIQLAVLSLDTLKPLKHLTIAPDKLFPSDVLKGGNTPDYLQQIALHEVAWGSDGERGYVFAAGTYPCRGAKVAAKGLHPLEQCLVRFDVQNPEDIAFLPIGIDRASDVVWLPKRGQLLLASPVRVTAMDANGKVLKAEDGTPFQNDSLNADLRGGDREFLIAPNGEQVVFTDYASTDGATMRVRFDLASLTVRQGASSDPTLLKPDQSQLVIRQWKDSVRRPPIIDNRQLEGPEYTKDETYRSVALLQRDKMAVVTSSEFIRVIKYGESGGATVACRTAVTEEAARVNITPDASLVVTGHNDGSLRWHRLTWSGDSCKLELLLTVYLRRTPSGEWQYFGFVPSGRFAFNVADLSLFEWQSLDKSSNPPRVVVTPYAQLSEWHEPAVVQAALRSPTAATPITPKDAELIVQRATPPPFMSVLTDPPLDGATGPRIKTRVGIFEPEKQTWPMKVSAWTTHRVPVKLALPGQEPVSELVIEQPTETIDLEFELPVSAQRVANLKVLFCLTAQGIDQECKYFTWGGPEVVAPRRLWAVIIGVAGYEVLDLKLPYADNDAVDLARLFASDHALRSVVGATEKPDFASVQVDLLVSPFLLAADELSKLTDDYPAIKVGSPDLTSVRNVLQAIVKRAEQEDISEDLFLFYFSGHGFVYQGDDQNSHTALALPKVRSDPNKTDIENNALTSKELIDVLKKIPSQRLIVIDACRTVQFSHPFDPSTAQLEFERNLLPVEMFFSNGLGQEARSSSDFSYNRTRPKSGNSYFTYAMMAGLTDPKAHRRIMDDPNRVTVDIGGLFDSVEWFFRSTTLEFIPAPGKPPRQFKQVPRRVPARPQFATPLLRSYQHTSGN